MLQIVGGAIGRERKAHAQNIGPSVENYVNLGQRSVGADLSLWRRTLLKEISR